jgi:predicted DCC family thiol-disulfide oxidoreductase YuxK
MAYTLSLFRKLPAHRLLMVGISIVMILMSMTIYRWSTSTSAEVMVGTNDSLWLSGFYSAEGKVRWSPGNYTIRVPAKHQGWNIVLLDLQSGHIQTDPIEIRLTTATNQHIAWNVSSAAMLVRRYAVLIPQVAGLRWFVPLNFKSSTFQVPNDPRELGVRLSRIVVSPSLLMSGIPNVLIFWWLTWAVLVLLFGIFGIVGWNNIYYSSVVVSVLFLIFCVIRLDGVLGLLEWFTINNNEQFNITVVFFIWFGVVALVVYLITRLFPVTNMVLPRISAFLQTRAFPYTSSQEHNKFVILRFFFGLVILLRAHNVASLLLPEEYFQPMGIYNGMEHFFALMIMFGFCTQFSLGFFIFVMFPIGAVALDTSTLGNDVAAMVAIFLLLTHSGRFLSVDSVIIKKRPALRGILGYGADLPNITTNTVAKFLLILSYCLVCLYSFLMHLDVSSWQTGIAGPLMFVNNFMSRYHVFFAQIFLQSNLAVLSARASIIIMLIWYVVLMPGIIMGGWWRRLVIIWGILFLCLSVFFLQLGSLSYFETIMWVALFWPKWGVDSSKKCYLFYDDKCNLCDRTVQFVRNIDVFDRIQLMPVSQNAVALHHYGITTETALEDLHGVLPDQGVVRAGYALYELLARQLILLWIVVPVLWLGRVLRIGPMIYRFIADRRRAMFGVCALPSPKAEWNVAPPPAPVRSLLFSMIACHILLLGTVFLFSMPMRYIGITGSSSLTSNAAHFYGVAVIDVFNNQDLLMMENWFTLTDATLNRLLPILDSDGSRLEYHKSDRIYFGHTLKFRRIEIGNSDCAFVRQAKMMRYLTAVWMNNSGLTGSRNFIYTQYYQAAPSLLLLEMNVYKPNPTEVRCSVEYTVTR